MLFPIVLAYLFVSATFFDNIDIITLWGPRCRPIGAILISASAGFHFFAIHEWCATGLLVGNECFATAIFSAALARSDSVVIIAGDVPGGAGSDCLLAIEFFLNIAGA